MVRVPAVVVRDHGHRRVAQLRLARELGLGHVGHADHVAVPAAVELRLRQARELRAFHHEVGAAARDLDASLVRRRREVVAEAVAHRLRHRHVRHQPGAEEALGAREGAVDELIDDDEGARAEMFAQGADRAHRDDVRHAGALERVDIGAEIDFRRRDLVTAAVTRQEDQLLAVQLAEQEVVRRLAERRGHLLPALVGQPLDVVDTAAPDDAEHLRPVLNGHGCNVLPA